MVKKQQTPSQSQLEYLLEHYKNGRYGDAEKLAMSLTQEFPKHQFGWKVLGAVLGQTGRNSEAVNAKQRAVLLAPQDAETHGNLGNTLKELRRLDEAEASYIKAIALKPDYVEAHYNLGTTLKEQGRLGEAAASYRQAVALKSDFAEAHNNLGITLLELGLLEKAEVSFLQAIESKLLYAEAYNNLGNTLLKLCRLDEARVKYKRAIELKPDYTNAFWNISGTEKTIRGAEYWIDKCLTVDANYLSAKFIKAALRFYQGDESVFHDLMKSKYRNNSYMRSFSWAFGLPNLPDLYFNRWSFFDAIVKKSIRTRPFYEFGVWRGNSFKYLCKSYQKGYGFDTFTGLPEDWHGEGAGSYSSNGNIPNVDGGEFIVGKFEDSLPDFFSVPRSLASVINFDADLYSSTLCALTNSRSIMDDDTILIFDEFIMNDNWERDEFKALNEFCLENHWTYKVIAISFMTKQVAVKLTRT